MFRIFSLCTLMLVALTGNTFAQNKDSLKTDRYESNTKTELNGHKFITNSLINDPFINTRFMLISGAGSSSNYDQVLYIKGKEIKGLFGQLTFGTIDIKYQQAINNWLAFAFVYYIQGRLGSQKISLISEGINFVSSFNFGWMVKLYKSKKFMTTATLALYNTSTSLFNIEDFVNKVIENGEITPDNRLVKTVNITVGSAGLRAAYAFSKTFGIIGKVNMGYGESLTTDKQAYVDAGLSVDADLNPKYSVPVGFALGYSWNNYSQSDISLKDPQNVMFKINYTGRKDLDLGLEAHAQFFNMNSFGQIINTQVLFMKACITYFF